jgi:hypothetical protein
MQAEEDRTHQLLDAKRTPRRGMPAEGTGETCDAWYERYHAYQLQLVRSAAHDARYRWKKWISPRLGPRPIASVTCDEVEDVRDHLDAQISEPRCRAPP